MPYYPVSSSSVGVGVVSTVSAWKFSISTGQGVVYSVAAPTISNPGVYANSQTLVAPQKFNDTIDISQFGQV